MSWLLEIIWSTGVLPPWTFWFEKHGANSATVTTTELNTSPLSKNPSFLPCLQFVRCAQDGKHLKQHFCSAKWLDATGIVVFSPERQRKTGSVSLSAASEQPLECNRTKEWMWGGWWGECCRSGWKNKGREALRVWIWWRQPPPPHPLLLP